MSGRTPSYTRTVAVGLLVLIVAIVVGARVPTTLVALLPGPTFDTLGSERGQVVVAVNGLPTYPTTGHFLMTTVGVADDLTGFQALRSWLDPNAEVVPRAAIYPPGKSDQQVQQENTAQFTNSENDAEVAALGYLHQPVKVVVGAVSPNAPARGVLKEGDQLLSVNGQQVTSPAQVSEALLATKPGQQVSVTYQRGDAVPVHGSVTVGARPDGGSQGFLGIVPEGRPEDPNQIKISLNDVGGPSAGLMFALAIVDKLTPGDLAGGKFIAGTGQIFPTGQVGPIGGISLKMIAARQAGASVFLVPAANCAEAAAHDPAGLQLIKVGSLSDAVTALTDLKAGHPVPSCSR